MEFVQAKKSCENSLKTLRVGTTSVLGVITVKFTESNFKLEILTEFVPTDLVKSSEPHSITEPLAK